MKKKIQNFWYYHKTVFLIAVLVAGAGTYLFLQQIYYQLKLPSICRQISKRNAFAYDLDNILSRLVYGRILFPSSKLSCLELEFDLN